MPIWSSMWEHNPIVQEQRRVLNSWYYNYNKIIRMLFILYRYIINIISFLPLLYYDEHYMNCNPTEKSYTNAYRYYSGCLAFWCPIAIHIEQAELSTPYHIIEVTEWHYHWCGIVSIHDPLDVSALVIVLV